MVMVPTIPKVPPGKAICDEAFRDAMLQSCTEAGKDCDQGCADDKDDCDSDCVSGRTSCLNTCNSNKTACDNLCIENFPFPGPPRNACLQNCSLDKVACDGDCNATHAICTGSCTADFTVCDAECDALDLSCGPAAFAFFDAVVTFGLSSYQGGQGRSGNPNGRFRCYVTDEDGDGIVTDNCPLTFNPTQDDTDGDGVGDACDRDPSRHDYFNPSLECVDGSCADVARNTSFGYCQGCDYGVDNTCQLDTDLDHVPQATDNCPDLANTDQQDGDEDGLGDACDACKLIPDASCIHHSGFEAEAD
jgi:hypothetical protein